MNETPRGPDLLAATRFVQAGRLTEATALLQRLLRGEPEHARRQHRPVHPSAKSGLIDLTPETLEVTEQRRLRGHEGVRDRHGNWPSSGTAGVAQPHARGAAQLP